MHGLQPDFTEVRCNYEKNIHGDKAVKKPYHSIISILV